MAKHPTDSSQVRRCYLQSKVRAASTRRRPPMKQSGIDQHAKRHFSTCVNCAALAGKILRILQRIVLRTCPYCYLPYYLDMIPGRPCSLFAVACQQMNALGSCAFLQHELLFAQRFVQDLIWASIHDCLQDTDCEPSIEAGRLGTSLAIKPLHASLGHRSKCFQNPARSPRRHLPGLCFPEPRRPSMLRCTAGCAATTFGTILLNSTGCRAD